MDRTLLKLFARPLTWILLILGVGTYLILTHKMPTTFLYNDTVQNVSINSQVLIENGGRVDWNNKTNKIVYDSKKYNNVHNIYISDTDGTNETCLTCDKQAIISQHSIGNPAWHPSGEYIVFQAVNNSLYDRLPQDIAIKNRITAPGVGISNDLWITDSTGNTFFKITDVALTAGIAGGVLHPQFSHNGKLLVWSERIKNTPGDLTGEWVIKLADFTIENGKPTLANIRSYQPGENTKKGLYETHGFSLDDTKVLFTAKLEKQIKYGFDIYSFDWTTNILTNLTNTKYTWDEHAHYDLSGSKILWMASYGYSMLTGLKTELWVSNADGSNKKRLTSFNDTDSDMYIENEGNGVVVGDFAIGPDNKEILVYVIFNEAKRAQYGQKGKIYLLSFDKPINEF